MASTSNDHRLKLNDGQYQQHFVHFYGWFEDRGDIGIAMEYYRHGDLAGYLLTIAAKVLPEAEVCHIIRQLVEGLRLLHDAGFAHRDLKPQVSSIKDS
jgi:serine/threonine protein kinase